MKYFCGVKKNKLYIMKKFILFLFIFVLYMTNTMAQSADNTKRALWASIAKDQSDGAVSLDSYNIPTYMR